MSPNNETANNVEVNEDNLLPKFKTDITNLKDTDSNIQFFNE